MHAAVRTWSGRGSAATTLAALREAGVSFATASPERLVLLDTFDGRLHADRIRIVWQERSGAGELIVSERHSPEARLALEAPPRFATEMPPGPLRSRLATSLDIRALLPLVAVTTTTAVGHCTDRHGKHTARIVLRRRPALTDDGPPAGRDVSGTRARTAGRKRRLPAWAVEVHPMVGYESRAAELAELLDGLDLRRTKGDLLDLAARVAGIDPAGVSTAPTVPLDAETSAADGVHAVLVNLFTTIEQHWDGTVAHLDPEFLHDLRVAVRRARSVLGESGAVLDPTERADARVFLGRLGELTGPSRDLDVFVLEWDDYVAPLPEATRRDLDPLLALIETHRTHAHHALSAAMSDEVDVAAVTVWRERFEAQAESGGDETDEGNEGNEGNEADETDERTRLGDFVAGRIRKAHRRLVRLGREIRPDSDAELLHDLRKDAKRLRYLVECFGGLLDDTRRKQFVGRLKGLQDNLGVHQDAAIHAAELRSFGDELAAGGGTVSTLLALGQLTELLEQRRQRARDEFATWFADFDTKVTRRSLRDLLDGLTAPDPAGDEPHEHGDDESHRRGHDGAIEMHTADDA